MTPSPLPVNIIALRGAWPGNNGANIPQVSGGASSSVGAEGCQPHDPQGSTGRAQMPSSPRPLLHIMHSLPPSLPLSLPLSLSLSLALHM